MNAPRAEWVTRVAIAGHAPDLVGRLAAAPGVRLVAQGEELRTLVALLASARPDVVYVRAEACGQLRAEEAAAQLAVLVPGARLAWLADRPPAEAVPPGVAWFALPEQADAAAALAAHQPGCDAQTGREGGNPARPPGRASGGQGGDGPPKPTRSGYRPFPGAAAAAGAGVSSCRVVSVFGAKGGVGKTTLAVNLAVAAAAEGQDAALLDLDLRAGCAAVHLDLLSDPTIVDLACAMPDVAPERLFEFAHRHAPSGLTVITGAPRPELGELVRADAIVRALELLAARHRCVVVDHGPGAAGEAFVDVLDRSHHALLVTTLDAASLRATRALLGALTRARQPLRDRVAVVCNGVGGRPAIVPREAEEFLGVRFAGALPADRGAEAAVADGAPLALQPGGELARAILALGRELGVLRSGDGAPRRPGPLAWLRGR